MKRYWDKNYFVIFTLKFFFITVRDILYLDGPLPKIDQTLKGNSSIHAHLFMFGMHYSLQYYQ